MFLMIVFSDKEYDALASLRTVGPMDVPSGLHVMRLVQQIDLLKIEMRKSNEAILQIKKRAADHTAVIKIILEAVQKFEQKIGFETDCQSALDFIVKLHFCSLQYEMALNV